MQDVQLTAPAILSLFETNKEERASFVTQTVEAIRNGEISPLKAHLQVKAMEDIINGLTSTDEKKNPNAEAAKQYRKMLLEEAELNGRKFELHNAKFDIKEVGTKYDYSSCNDPKLLDLEAAELAATEALKARQKFLQNIPETGITEVDQDTGEAVTIYRPLKTSTTSVTVSLK